MAASTTPAAPAPKANEPVLYRNITRVPQLIEYEQELKRVLPDGTVFFKPAFGDLHPQKFARVEA
jgi:hypothetical protein